MAAPELQLIHKFANLHILASHTVPESTPVEFVKCFQQVKEYEAVVPNPILSGMTVLQYYQRNIVCLSPYLCPLKLPQCEMINPGRQKIMSERERIDLQGYGAEHVDYVPLQYTQFNQIRVF